jgi:hypothetical protein
MEGTMNSISSEYLCRAVCKDCRWASKWAYDESIAQKYLQEHVLENPNHTGYIMHFDGPGFEIVPESPPCFAVCDSCAWYSKKMRHSYDEAENDGYLHRSSNKGHKTRVEYVEVPLP